MKVLVINTGSSSIKFQCFDMDTERVLLKGLVEKIGEDVGKTKYSYGDKEFTVNDRVPNHKNGLEFIAKLLVDPKDGIIKDKSEITAVGHRTVHGGEKFHFSSLITSEVLDAIKEMVPIAPLHNPANITGIEVAQEIFPNAHHIAVFDTAFHQTMPDYAYRYAIPNDFYTRLHIRRYGFHGTSHLYVAKEVAKFLSIPFDKFNAITIHAGNGSSMAAIRGGKSVDTTMGMTPLEGLIMGTRSGDLDPAIPHYIVSRDKSNIDMVNVILNKQSGLKGICGSNDVREIQERLLDKNDKDAKLALEMYAYRIKKYIGAFCAVLNSVDAIIFTAGVGENSSLVRKMSCLGLENLGICFDEEKNSKKISSVFEVSKSDSKIKVIVAPTNEELEIARQSVEVLKRH